MKKLVINAGLAAFVLALVAISLSKSALFSPPREERKSEVISEFIHLSLAPDANNLDFLSSGRTQRVIRATRLEHIHPALLAEFARLSGIPEDRLRAQMSDPSLSNAFDITGVVFDSPKTFQTGQTAEWAWALVTQSAEDRASDEAASAECGLSQHCGAWLLSWTDETWYYAPVGAAQLDQAVIDAMPWLEAVIRDELGAI